MCPQLAIKEEQRESRQEDFPSLPSVANGSGVRLLPGEGQLATEVVGAATEELLTGAVAERTTVPVVVEGALVASTRFGELKLPMISRAQLMSDGDPIVSFSDYAETLLLRIVGDTGILNVNTRYIGKPLEAALSSARFFEALATTPGVLYFEVNELIEDGDPVRNRIGILDLPLTVPEQELEKYRNRLLLLEGLYDIFVNTGVGITYPADTEDEEGLDNFNFVLKAIRSGWVASAVASFNTHVPEAEVRPLLDELRDEGQVLRAFMFDLTDESYRVFGKEVSLGPSRRYVAAARLTTSRQEIEAWLGEGPENMGALDLKWEPVDDTPIHVFFDEWPKSDVGAIDRELREFEAAYGVSSERFGRAWQEREHWTEGVPDGKRWFSLIQAREELTREP